MPKAQSFATDVLDMEYPNGASGTFVVGSTTYTLPVRAKFLTTASTATAAGTEWATAAGYTAGGVSCAGLYGTAAATGAKSNATAISVVNAPSGVWIGNEWVDSSGTPKRMNFGALTGSSKNVNLGDTCTIPPLAAAATEA